MNTSSMNIDNLPSVPNMPIYYSMQTPIPDNINDHFSYSSNNIASYTGKSLRKLYQI